jgi:hypothetical protein
LQNHVCVGVDRIGTARHGAAHGIGITSRLSTELIQEGPGVLPNRGTSLYISERLRWGERWTLEKYILNKPVPTWLHALIRNDGLLKYKNHVKHK